MITRNKDELVNITFFVNQNYCAETGVCDLQRNACSFTEILVFYKLYRLIVHSIPVGNIKIDPPSVYTTEYSVPTSMGIQ